MNIKSLKSTLSSTIIAGFMFLVNTNSGFSNTNQEEFKKSTRLTLSKTIVHDLKINANQVEFMINYPGAGLSGLCGIEIRAKERYFHFSKLTEELKFENIWGVEIAPTKIFADVIVVDAVPSDSSYYLGSVRIVTKSGKTILKTVTDTIGEEGSVFVFPKLCY